MENKYFLTAESNEEEQRKQAVLDRIYLPGKEDGYARGTLVGSSGAGKTSLLRFLAGTTKEKFPATATARTTTCNLELIFSREPVYEIAVSFMSRQRFEEVLMENIEAAVRYCLQSAFGQLCLPELAEKLLDHRDQTLRLSYLLGDPALLKPQNETDPFDEEFFGFPAEMEQKDDDPSADTQELAQKISAFLRQVEMIAQSYSQRENFSNDEL